MGRAFFSLWNQHFADLLLPCSSFPELRLHARRHRNHGKKKLKLEI
jgi:hypothetical protein